MVGVHGGVKFYRGSATAARNYVEADRSRADDYYLAEGTGVATRYVATCTEPGASALRAAGGMDGATYERWVAGFDVTTGEPKGRLRRDENALRFVEVVVNGPKSWSLAASLHAAVADAYDAAQDRAAQEVIGWLAEHATTRVGPRGRQVQVPVEEIEAAVVRHYTSRAGDPHRHLHLQINARVFAHGRWRGLHSVGVVDMIEGINGIGHAALMCDPRFRRTLADHGYSLLPDGEISQLVPFVGVFSRRAAQIGRHTARHEAVWRADHPGREPGPRLWQAWDRRAWAQARPDKVTPTDGAALVARWNQELLDLGYRPPAGPAVLPSVAVGRVNRDAAAELVLIRLGSRRSAWNHADIRGETERLIAAVGVVAERWVRWELVEDITARASGTSVRLLPGPDVPGHVRALTSRRVLAVEEGLNARFADRATTPVEPLPVGRVVCRRVLDPAQREVVAAIAGRGALLVVEGAAGSGKTTTLAAARELLEMQDRRLVVVTPTKKAAQVASAQLRTPAHSAAWLAHQHGYRWDSDGMWTRLDTIPEPEARLLPGDVLLVDEAGMLDQDLAHAVLTIADQTHARVVLVGDRHQLPAVGRGGVLDLAARWVPPPALMELDAVHRFTDPGYAELTLLMRTGTRSGEVFDTLLERGQIVVHATEVERTAAIAALAGHDPDSLVIADTRDQVATLNGAIRDHRHASGTGITAQSFGAAGQLTGEAGGERGGERAGEAAGATIRAGEHVEVGDRVTTRRNDRELGVANRDTWTVTGVDRLGGLQVTGRNGVRTLPGGYVRQHVELAYATTVHGAQGETVDTAHFLLGEATATAAAYVAMTRGRHQNVAHLVADGTDQARHRWVGVFDRDRADLGPAHATRSAREAVDRYGPQTRRMTQVYPSAAWQATASWTAPHRRPAPAPFTGGPDTDRGGISR